MPHKQTNKNSNNIYKLLMAKQIDEIIQFFLHPVNFDERILSFLEKIQNIKSYASFPIKIFKPLPTPFFYSSTALSTYCYSSSKGCYYNQRLSPCYILSRHHIVQVKSAVWVIRGRTYLSDVDINWETRKVLTRY